MRGALLVATLLSLPATAGVMAYRGLAGETLFIEEAPALGKKTFLVKFEGVNSAWAGKVIRVEQSGPSGRNRYAFTYDLELSSGTQKRGWELLVDAGFELVNGSRVPKVQLFVAQSSAKELYLVYDPELTKASQKIGLAAEHAKSPFKPDVD